MKVRELKEILKKHGDNAEVILVTDWESRAHYHEVSAVTCDDFDGNQEVYIVTEDA